MREKMKTICWFSCGVTSAVACKIALHDCENCEIIFIATGQEEKDSLRFLKDCEDWFQHEIKITHNEHYSDAFDVWEQTRYLNGVGGARCTLELKKKMRYQIEDELKVWNHQVFGFDVSEKMRAKRFAEQNPKAKAIFPLIDRCLTKSDCMGILKNANIEIPLMYRLGFTNNNCIGCVKGGKGYWNLIRQKFPDVFTRMSILEREIGHSCINGMFLDDMPKNIGRLPVIVPSCSLYCDPDFMDI